MSLASSFRKEFAFNFNGTINWFPGHMAKATRLMRERLNGVDIVLEVRDARVPISSGNVVLESIVRDRSLPHVVVLNKADLANHNLTKRVAKYFEERNKVVLFTSTVSKSKNTHVQRLIPTALEHYHKSRKQLHTPSNANTADNKIVTKQTLNLMIMGVPNVGKSTIINSLRRHCLSESDKREKGIKMAKTGPLPGVTRGVSGFKVSSDPLAFLVDTPGVMLPRIDNLEVGLKLALTGAIKESVVGKEVIADFLLYSMNRLGLWENYMQVWGLKEPSDSIEVVLSHIANKIGAKKAQGELDTEVASLHFLKKYHSGELGRFTLDEIP